MKFGVRYNYTALRRVSQVNQNGTFTFNTNASFDAANPRTYPERLSIRTGRVRGERQEPHLRSVRPGQMAASARARRSTSGVRYDLEIIPLDETGNPLFSPGQAAPTDKNNISPRVVVYPFDGCGRQVGDPRRIRDLLQPDDPRRRRRHAGVRQVHLVECRDLPDRVASPIPGRAPAGSRPTRTWSTARSSTATLLNAVVSARRARCGTTAS